MRSMLRNQFLAVAGVAVMAVAILPTAEAQSTSLDMSMSLSKQLLIPEGEVATLTVDVMYSFTGVASPTGTAASQAVTVTFTPTCPTYILVVGPETKIINLPPQGVAQNNFQGEVQAQFAVTVTREAPGLKTLTCSMEVTASELAATAAPAPPPVKQSFSLIADYYALVQAKVNSKLKTAGPQKNVPFDIELSNFGNARTQVSFEVGERPSGKRWNALLPDNLILDSPNGGGEGKTSDTTTFTVATTYKNGWNNEQGAFQVIMKPSSADQPEKVGNPITANVLVRVRGVYIPTLEPLLMLGAVLGVALVARLSRDE